MNTKLLNAILDRQMTSEQIEVLEEFLDALNEINSVNIQDAFFAEASDHKVFNVCYKEDTNHLVERVEEAFPNLEGLIEQLNYEDYCTDHDTYDSIEKEQEAKEQLITKIDAWKDSVNLFLENLYECY